jgi:hypothetical protein
MLLEAGLPLSSFYFLLAIGTPASVVHDSNSCSRHVVDLRLSSLRTGIQVRRRERQLAGELRGVRGRPELAET